MNVSALTNMYFYLLSWYNKNVIDMKKINEYLEPFQNFVRILKNPELRRLVFKKMYADVYLSIQRDWVGLVMLFFTLFILICPENAHVVVGIFMVMFCLLMEIVETYPKMIKGLALIYKNPLAFPRLFRRWKRNLVEAIGMEYQNTKLSLEITWLRFRAFLADVRRFMRR